MLPVPGSNGSVAKIFTKFDLVAKNVQRAAQDLCVLTIVFFFRRRRIFNRQTFWGFLVGHTKQGWNFGKFELQMNSSYFPST